MKRIILLFTVFLFVGINHITAQELKSFVLPNGLTVFIWEDASKPNVMGMVSVKAGAKDDPEQYTGLAHYLEHLLFKGTEKIGTLDWNKEKSLYEQIIQLYDKMAAETNPAQKKSIAEEINRLSIEASQLTPAMEFASLSEGTLGGYGLNAGTNYDYTVYFNAFSPEEIFRWLELNSERLINPVYRGFQAELETVYEEYNRVMDQQMRQINAFLLETIFPGHPYSRSVIGLGEHLKNPQLSQLKKFYDTWYVPGNMALILVGNIKTEEILPRIRSTFGRLPKKELPVAKQYPETTVKGRKQVSAKISPYPMVMMSFPSVTQSNPDYYALEICNSILTNRSNTGLLDKLRIDGDLMMVTTGQLALKERGALLVQAIPYYDINQRRFNSLKATENLLLGEIKKLKNGDFDEDLILSVKGEMIRQFDLQMESSEFILNMLSTVFVNEIDPADFLDYKEAISNISTEQIKETAKKYYGNNYYALHLDQGKGKKGEKLEKPKLEPLQTPQNAKSLYATQLEAMPVTRKAVEFADMNAVQVRPINERSKLFYTENTENNVFSLVLKYGVGTAKMPKLEMAVSLMNDAGIMGQMKAQEVKKEFSNLGASCRYSVSDNYLYVRMDGFEDNLDVACNLMTRQILLPELDEKQMKNMTGGVYQSRAIEKTQFESISSAMNEYIRYGERSDYIDRPALTEITELSISNLTGEFQRATDYEAEIHYVGNLPFDEVYEILSKNLPLKQGEKASTSPEVKPLAPHAENTIYFTPNSDAKQSAIHIHIEGENYNKYDDIFSRAFGYYFGQGFNSVLWQEVREYRSMAYEAWSVVQNPPVPGFKSFLYGFVGTQADNTNKAIDLVFELLTNMPEHPERMTNVKNYLRQTTITNKPDFRSASQTYQTWKLKGYEKTPAEENLPIIDKLTFDDLKKYYEDRVKNGKVVIGIVGDPKQIDLKALEKYGKVVRVATEKLFSAK